MPLVVRWRWRWHGDSSQHTCRPLDYRLQYAEHLAKLQPGKSQAEALGKRLQLMPEVGPVSAADRLAIRLYLDSLRVAAPAEPQPPAVAD